MKKSIAILLLLLTLPLASLLRAQCVVNIPDANFKAALIANGVINTNSDGEIQCDEAAAYTGGIDVSNLSISNLTGIEAFVQITELNCSENSLTSLDVSSNTALIELKCYSNQLTSLDVSSNTALGLLLCNNNHLRSLNVKNGNNANIYNQGFTNNPDLFCIQVDDAEYMTSSNIWGEGTDPWASFSEDCACIVNIPDANFKNALLGMGVDTNSDGEIQCSEAAHFRGSIDVSFNNISDLTGIEAFINLEELNCSFNSLTSLDFSANKALIYLYCNNNTLTSLNVKNGNNLNFADFVASNNPDLSCIQVDDAVWSTDNWVNIGEIAHFSNNCTCSSPTDAGEIEANKTSLCVGDTAGVEFSNSIFPSGGELGSVEYQWQSSTDGVNFSDLAVGTFTSADYVSEALTDTTYFRRLARVSCMTDWTDAVASNVIKITVNPLPKTPVIGAITQPDCINATGSVELTDLPIGNWTVNPGANAGSSLSATIYNLPTGINNLTVTDQNGCTSLPTADITIDAQPELPTMQASSLNVSAISTQSMTVSWTRGSGDGVVVVARYGGDVSTNPQGGTIYTADSSFGKGNQVGNGNFVVYNGTGTSVDVTGLTAHTSYYFAVYEYKLSTNCYLVPALTGNATTLAICSAGSLDTSTEYITNVSIGSINQNSGQGTGGYEDYTSDVIPLEIGQNISATIGFNATNASNQLLIWIDWNKDGDFNDEGESVYTSVNSTITSPHTTATFAPPTGAALGTTRMRIRLQDTTSGSNDTPCGTSDKGEVEDYSISVYNTQIVMGPNVTICRNDSVQLQASGGLIYSWTPTTGLSNPTIANPYASPSQTTTYYLTSNAQGPNLITNGDFSAGNTGFSSEYEYSATTNQENFYTVTPNPFWWHNLFSECGDHTSGKGNMMVINGTYVDNAEVWGETINVKPNTDYAFSTWVASVHPAAPAVLQFSINGQLLDVPFNITPTTCDWQRFYQVWNSGSNTTAEIKIVNQNTQYFGNDFALDDIYFSEMESKGDSVVVTVLDLPEAPVAGAITHPTCPVATGSVELSNLPAVGSWVINPGAISGTGTSTVISGLTSGSYNFTVTNASGCTSPKSETVVINPQPIQAPPVVNITSQPTCTNAYGSVELSGLPNPWILAQSPGSTSDGTGTTTSRSNLLSGTYSFVVTNQDGCVSKPAVVIIKTPPVVGPIVGETHPCIGSSQNYTGTSVYDDWFMPSKDELYLMYTNLHLYGVGNFSSDIDLNSIYWSSSDSLNSPWVVNFANGVQGIANKIYSYHVRAARSFVSEKAYALRDVGPAGGLIFYKSGNYYLESAPVDQGPGYWHDNLLPWGCDGNNIEGAQGTAVGTGEANTKAILAECTENYIAAKATKDYHPFVNVNCVWTVPNGWTINSGQGTHIINVTPGSEIGEVSLVQTDFCPDIIATIDVTPKSELTQPGAIAGVDETCESSVQTYSVANEATEYHDWFLPSIDEYTLMYNNLHLFGVGNFSTDNVYWSSSENENFPWTLNFSNGVRGPGNKGYSCYVRAARAFTSSTAYEITDRGPAGGYIFYKNGNDYMECAPADQGPGAWNDHLFMWGCDGVVISGANGTAVGTGATNTQAILEDCSETPSAVRACTEYKASDFVYNWTFPSGWSIVSGQGTNSVSVTVGAEAGTISVTKSNLCGVSAATTYNATTINSLPNISAQPSSPSAVCAPKNSSDFTVSANGTGISYQWQRGISGNYTDITDATSPDDGCIYSNFNTATLTVANAVESMNGYTYRCVVSGTCALPQISDGNATLTVGPDVWLGTTSADWNTASNWCGGVPIATTNVIIPQGTPHNAVVNINTPAVCKTLTIDGGKLANDGMLTVADTITFVENGVNTSELLANGPVINNGVVKIRKDFKSSDGWAFMAFPFDVPADNIYIAGTDTRATWGDAAQGTGYDFYVCEYDGQKRDQTGTVVNANSPNWKSVSPKIFEANKGYIVAVASDKTIDFISSADPASTLFNTNATVTVNLYTTNRFSGNHSWNLVGVPFSSAYDLKYTSQDQTPFYYYDANASTYATVMADDSYETHPFTSFFVQANPRAVKPNSLSFSSNGRVIRSVYVPTFDEIGLMVKHAKYSDKVRIRLEKEAGKTYEIGKDAIKFFTPKTEVPQIYCQEKGQALSVASLPESTTKVDVSVKMGEGGAYTISLEDIANIKNCSQVILQDGEIETDLLEAGSYSFTGTAGSTKSLSVLLVPTGTTNLTGQNGGAIVIKAIGDKAYINGLQGAATVNVYDVAGKLLQSFTNVNNNDALSLNSKGVCIINVENTMQTGKAKVFVK